MKQTLPDAATPSAKNDSTVGRSQELGSAIRPAQHRASEIAVVAHQISEPRNADSAGIQPFTLLKECSDWLSAHPPQVIENNRPLRRVYEVTNLLQMPSTSKQRVDVQERLKQWGVAQKIRGRKRHFDDVKEELEQKVLHEVNRLQRLHNETGESILNQRAPMHNAGYSAIVAAFRKAT